MRQRIKWIGAHTANGSPSFISAIASTKTELALFMLRIPHDERSNCRFQLRCFDVSKMMCSVLQFYLKTLSPAECLGRALETLRREERCPVPRDGCCMNENFEATDATTFILSAKKGANTWRCPARGCFPFIRNDRLERTMSKASKNDEKIRKWTRHGYEEDVDHHTREREKDLSHNTSTRRLFYVLNHPMAIGRVSSVENGASRRLSEQSKETYMMSFGEMKTTYLKTTKISKRLVSRALRDCKRGPEWTWRQHHAHKVERRPRLEWCCKRHHSQRNGRNSIIDPRTTLVCST